MMRLCPFLALWPPVYSRNGCVSIISLLSFRFTQHRFRDIWLYKIDCWVTGRGSRGIKRVAMKSCLSDWKQDGKRKRRNQKSECQRAFPLLKKKGIIFFVLRARSLHSLCSSVISADCETDGRGFYEKFVQLFLAMTKIFDNRLPRLTQNLLRSYFFSRHFFSQRKF